MTITGLANQAVGNLHDGLDHLAEIYGEEITDSIELLRCLRWQVEFYKAQARELKEQFDEANTMLADLSDSNMDLRMMLGSAHKRMLETQKMEVAQP